MHDAPHDIDQVTPEQVAAALSHRADAVYLDVRTVEEFVAGHPPMALNIPLHVRAPGGVVVDNRDFLAVVRAVVPVDSTVFCGCAHGIRSLHAAFVLRSEGWANVANVGPGYDGRHDFLGRLVEPGWLECGLPVNTGEGGEFSYRALRTAAEVQHA